MKKEFILFIIVCSVALISMFSGCIQEGTGTLTLLITDDPSDLNITEALVTMSEVRVHYAGLNESVGNGSWITIVNQSQTFDLVLLQNVTDLFGSANLSAGWYTQIRLMVDQALVTIDGVQYDLKIPSKTVKLIKPFRVLDNQTTTLLLDFDVHESVHESSEDKYIFNPTIKVIQL